MSRRGKKPSKNTQRALAALGLVSSDEEETQSSIAIPEWGSIIEFEKYLAMDRVSSHSLMDFSKSPRLYKRKKDGLIPREKKSHYSFGTAFHKFTLEGSEEFAKEYQVGGEPINEKTGKPYGPTSQKYIDWFSKQTKTVISESDYAKIVEMHQAVMATPKAVAILEEGIPELCVLTEIMGHKVKQRFDWWNPEVVLDVKTTRSLETFEEDFWKYGYDIQVGMHGLIMDHLIHTIPPFYVLACEKAEPYPCKLYRICEDTQYQSIQRVQQMLFKLEGCIMDDLWLYGTETEGVI